MTTLFVNQVSFLTLGCQLLKCILTQSKARGFFYWSVTSFQFAFVFGSFFAK